MEQNGGLPINQATPTLTENLTPSHAVPEKPKPITVQAFVEQLKKDNNYIYYNDKTPKEKAHITGQCENIEKLIELYNAYKTGPKNIIYKGEGDIDDMEIFFRKNVPHFDLEQFNLEQVTDPYKKAILEAAVQVLIRSANGPLIFDVFSGKIRGQRDGFLNYLEKNDKDAWNFYQSIMLKRAYFADVFAYLEMLCDSELLPQELSQRLTKQMDKLRKKISETVPTVIAEITDKNTVENRKDNVSIYDASPLNSKTDDAEQCRQMAIDALQALTIKAQRQVREKVAV